MARPPGDEVDVDRPNVARIYDYLLGGAHNFHADRAAAKHALAIAPAMVDAARGNRAFLRRAVQHALDDGVRQFLDLGSGISTVGNLRRIVHAADPHATVLHVDHDPVVAAHTRALLDDTNTAGIIHADLRDTDTILDHPETARLIDFHRPVAVLLVYVLHFLPDDPTSPVAALCQPLTTGSHLVISHATTTTPHAGSDAVQGLYAGTPTPLQPRSRRQIRALFTGFDLIHPHPDSTTPADLVPAAAWRPDPADTPPPTQSPYLSGLLAAAARKPSTAAAVPTGSRMPAAGASTCTPPPDPTAADRQQPDPRTSHR
ncbi:SAM-dependent methyltransferase [Phytohabitans houttuyneae]|uniref:S-adenosyl methyltransferase n=1 Tax=Phytohabitans houttuyneae TaxID=1076126 RepID=A0A6V8K6X2_9ACTN|nr:SAM-dependent methyltransferase [Phytohabitans houttuyneae]GFJ77497.1 hypothetical protein Phou_016770 [Phytohabitans houttuyneae]